ncbi:MAG TPA: ACT domain-containing protein [Firmicutes bacterium]|nr:ACT domain-containing protein [Bacillota bacterium]
MKAVITVIGKDMVGILGKVCNTCSEKNVNVLEVTQSVLQDLFVMIMMVDISAMTCNLAEFSDNMEMLGRSLGLSIHVMHEDIFHSMHRI